MKGVIETIESSHKKQKREMEKYYEESEKLGEQIEGDESQAQNMRNALG